MIGYPVERLTGCLFELSRHREPGVLEADFGVVLPAKHRVYFWSLRLSKIAVPVEKGSQFFAVPVKIDQHLNLPLPPNTSDHILNAVDAWMEFLYFGVEIKIKEVFISRIFFFILNYFPSSLSLQ